MITSLILVILGLFFGWIILMNVLLLAFNIISGILGLMRAVLYAVLLTLSLVKSKVFP